MNSSEEAWTWGCPVGRAPILWTDYERARYLRTLIAESWARLAELRCAPTSNAQSLSLEQAILAGFKREMEACEASLFLAP